LLKRYGPWETSLNLTNGKLLIYDEDVHATLGLAMGTIEMQELKHSDSDVE